MPNGLATDGDVRHQIRAAEALLAGRVAEKVCGFTFLGFSLHAFRGFGQKTSICASAVNLNPDAPFSLPVQFRVTDKTLEPASNPEYFKAIADDLSQLSERTWLDKQIIWLKGLVRWK